MQQENKMSSDSRRLDRDHEELEVLNDIVRKLMLAGIPGAADLYRRNRELLKQCERSRNQKAAPSRGVGELTSRALSESQELLDKIAPARNTDQNVIDSTREH